MEGSCLQHGGQEVEKGGAGKEMHPSRLSPSNCLCRPDPVPNSKSAMSPVNRSETSGVILGLSHSKSSWNFRTHQSHVGGHAASHKPHTVPPVAP